MGAPAGEGLPPPGWTAGAPSANPNFYVAAFPDISISGRGNATPPLNGPAIANVNDPATVTDIYNRLMTQWFFNNAAPANSLGFGSMGNNGLAFGGLKLGAPVDSIFPVPVPTPAKFFASSDKVGSDIVLNNVISMQIRVMIKEGLVATQLFQDDLPTSLGAYPRNLDTANGSGIVIRAIQIKLRVWDTKNSITRQITITQDL